MSGVGNPDVLLAFDFGFRRIGVASGNLLTRTASPLAGLRTFALVTLGGALAALVSQPTSPLMILRFAFSWAGSCGI